MTDGDVAALYDCLCDVESRRHPASSYPVHKQLRLEDPRQADIYDWIIDACRPTHRSSVLDAGCGVGYGAVRMAGRCGCSVLGISLSTREVAAAEYYARQQSRIGNVRFQCGSFDAQLDEQFDLIVAVESLKHSADVTRSITRLAARLENGGELLIVEDVLIADRENLVDRRSTDCLLASWHLHELMPLERYTSAVPCASVEVIDFTPMVRQRGGLWNRLRFVFLGVIERVGSGRVQQIARIFRAGVALEHLYAVGAMRYVAIRIRPHGGESA